MEVKELGHLVLYVRDLERSRTFYRDIIGWREIGGSREGAAMFSAGRTHHELLLIEVGESAQAIPQGRRVGLYHFGLKIGETDGELKEAVDRLQQARVHIVGSADHGVTHSVYLLDPDGNELEIYIDVQPELWRDNPEAVLVPTKPLML